MDILTRLKSSHKMNNDDYVNMVVNVCPTEWEKAKNILKEYNSGAQLTAFSCNPEILHMILDLANDPTPENEESLRKIAELSSIASRSRIWIGELIKEMEHAEKLREVGKVKVEEFFRKFEDPATKERLFIVVGETGVGKSYMIQKRYPDIIQYACDKRYDPYTLCYHFVNEGGELTPKETPFLKALKEGKKVFLDEMNMLPHDTLLFIQGITDEKDTVVIGDEVVEISPNFKIIGAMNPPSDTDERNPLGDALLSRAVGIVLELTDEMIAERIGVSIKFIELVRKFHGYVANSRFIDVRELNFRDFKKLYEYDFSTQFQFMFCVHDKENLKKYKQLRETEEFKNLVLEIEEEKEKIREWQRT